MGDHTTIEWTDATWNPVRGCAIVSKGCTNCYAMRQAHRSSGAGGAYEGLTKLSKGGPVWTGKVRTVPQLLDQPLRWRRPRRIFVNSMSDLFHEDVDIVFIASVLGIGASCPHHTLQVLTKRPRRMLAVIQSLEFREAYASTVAMYCDTFLPWPAPNVWLGVSVEDQAAADERIPPLLETPAAVRWISAEPLLGPVDLHISDRQEDVLWRRTRGGSYERRFIDWVVAGGESGPGARPMHPDWARSLRDQCAAAGVPFFFKQWGAWRRATCADDRHGVTRLWLPSGIGPQNGPDVHPLWMTLTGKKSAGRELDGRTHDEYPA